MISLDAVLYKINMLIQKGELDYAIQVLEDTLVDDLVDQKDEKQLNIKFLQLLLLRKNPEDIQNFKEWSQNIKKEEYSKEMTEYVYSFVSYLLTFEDLDYDTKDYKRYKEILSWAPTHVFYIVLQLTELSYSLEETEARLDAQTKLITDYFELLKDDEQALSDAKDYFREVKVSIANKETMNSDEKRMLELFFILNI